MPSPIELNIGYLTQGKMQCSSFFLDKLLRFVSDHAGRSAVHFLSESIFDDV